MIILLFASGGVTNVTILLDSTYVAGFAIRPFIEIINCELAAVLLILVPRSIPPVCNLNESFVPSTNSLIECPTTDPNDYLSIA